MTDDLQEKLKKAQEQAAKKDEKDAKKAQAQDDNNAEVETLKKQLEEMTETAKRAMADMQNLRRRIEQERIQSFSSAASDIASNCLPILDNLDRAIEHTPKDIESSEANKEWLNGLKMSLNQFHQVFTDLGLEQIESLNKPFNPDLHEAIAQGPGEKDTVTEEFEKGYKLGDRVIRHSKVKVGDGS